MYETKNNTPYTIQTASAALYTSYSLRNPSQ